ncbi:MAG: hypothetical protein HGA39_01190 [Coriobacteriia bacterium]|nr:hypothetical protein [Coriobacteriia bacterium]
MTNAYEHILTTAGSSGNSGRTRIGSSEYSAEFMEKVYLAIESAPETSDDRVRRAVENLCASGIDSKKIASHMIESIVLESLR